VLLNTVPEEPYGGVDLDDPDVLAALDEFVGQARPGLVVIDSLTNSTCRNICIQSEVAALKKPLLVIAQKHQVTILLLLHLSREGQALGRRSKGLTRTLLQLDRPDAKRPEKLRLRVEKTKDETPDPLGVTITAKGNEYDTDPPDDPPARSKGGRPAEKREQAIAFLVERLTDGDRKACELIEEWEESGENKGTLYHAQQRMVKDGRLTVDESQKPHVWHLNESDGDDT
jgi:hypothetical protein